MIFTTRDRTIYGEGEPRSGDSASRKSAADVKVEFSGIDSFAGNGVGVIAPRQLDKSAASMLSLTIADRVLIQTSAMMFSRICTASVLARS